MLPCLSLCPGSNFREAVIQEDLIWLNLLLIGASINVLTHISSSQLHSHLIFSCLQLQATFKNVSELFTSPTKNLLQQVVFDSLACNILCQIWETFWKVYLLAKQSKLYVCSYEHLGKKGMPEFHHKVFSNRTVFCRNKWLSAHIHVQVITRVNC